MTKRQLNEAIARRVHAPPETSLPFLEAFVEEVKAALLRGDDVSLNGFGCFRIQRRAPKRVRNPKTGRSMKLPARDVPDFRASEQLIHAVRERNRTP